jgi:hypothetical protein
MPSIANRTTKLFSRRFFGAVIKGGPSGSPFFFAYIAVQNSHAPAYLHFKMGLW